MNVTVKIKFDDHNFFRYLSQKVVARQNMIVKAIRVLREDFEHHIPYTTDWREEPRMRDIYTSDGTRTAMRDSRDP